MCGAVSILSPPALRVPTFQLHLGAGPSVLPWEPSGASQHCESCVSLGLSEVQGREKKGGYSAYIYFPKAATETCVN